MKYSFRSNIKPRISIMYFLLTLSFSVSTIAYGQIPNGYYDNAQGLTGDNLKAALHDIIKGHTEYPYSSSGTDVWDILKEADKDPNNSANVIGIYSNFSMNAADEYANGAGWNREHVWAKSRGDFGTSPGAGTDLHHIRAADVSTNSARNNRNFDSASEQYVDGSGNYSGPTDSKTSSTDWVWEPRDAVKGDVARMILYMTVRYEGGSGEPDLELTETLLSNTDKSPLHAKMSTLLAWHLADPVSSEEQNRNDVVYSFQNNRNPFIDHPEYVCEIYSCTNSGDNAPIFTSTPITSATEGQPYTYNVVATDSDGDNLTISGTTIPSWSTLTDQGMGSAILSGTPGTGDIGTHSVVLSLSDGSNSTTQSFTITVTGSTGGNSAPVFTSSPVTGATENQPYTYSIVTSDADADNITITGTTIPSWLTLTDHSGGSATLSGTPNSSNLGSHNVELKAADGMDDATQSFVIVVSAADGSSDASDLFFSEYIEGSSFNKGLEVANFTSGSVDLSSYSLQKQTNGAGSWGSSLSLSGSLAKGDVFVVVNSSADDTMQDQADVVTGSGAVTFNGNDAVGLFKNGELIDIIGTFNGGTANFAKDVTLTRNANIKDPNTSYTNSEWTSHASNTFSFLGSHTFGDTPNPCEVPSGLSTSNITVSSADLNWSGISEAMGYNIQYKLKSATEWVSETSAAEMLSLSGLISNSAYEFQVQTVCSNGTSEFTSSASFNTSAATNLNDLFFSEYIEGSSQNKAIEIVNITGSSKDLSVYSLKKQTDGSGDWGSELILSGTLSDKDVYVVANSASSSSITDKADLTTSSEFVSFNGNDPVGLFKNGDLIDVIGIFGGGPGNFAADQTLIRKTDIAESSNAYISDEWTSLAMNSSDDLGKHTYSGGTIPVVTTLSNSRSTDNRSIELFPNPVKGTINLSIALLAPNSLSVVVYNYEGQLVFSKNDNMNAPLHMMKLDVSRLPIGLYILKAYDGTGHSFSKKFSIKY